MTEKTPPPTKTPNAARQNQPAPPMAKPHGEQSNSTNLCFFIEDIFTNKPQTNKVHSVQNRTISETVFQNSSSGEKAPGLSNGLRY